MSINNAYGVRVGGVLHALPHVEVTGARDAGEVVVERKLQSEDGTVDVFQDLFGSL